MVIDKLKTGDKILVLNLNCGALAYRRFCTMGIRPGNELIIKSIQPYGPITVEQNRTELSIGRGLFSKIEYEVIED